MKNFLLNNKAEFGGDSIKYLEYQNFINEFLKERIANKGNFEFSTFYFNNDKIWQDRRFSNTIFNEQTFSKVLYSYDYKNLVFKIHNEKDSLQIDNEINLYNKTNKFEIIKNLKRRKKLLNYDCYYVKIILEKHKIQGEPFMGNQIYEMYVTDSIKLPIHPILNSGLTLNDFFPLEVKIYEDKFPGSKFYRIREISKL